MLTEILNAIAQLSRIPDPELRYQEFRKYSDLIGLDYSKLLHLLSLYDDFNQTESDE